MTEIEVASSRLAGSSQAWLIPMHPRPRTPTWGPPLSRVVVRMSAGDDAAGLDREPVDEVVHRVAGVPLDPPEGDVPAVAHRQDQWFPQVAVGDGLLGAVDPAPAQPPPPPAVPEAVDDVGGVADHDEGTLEGPHRLERCTDLHPLVGRRRFATARLPSVPGRPGPAAGAGVARAGAVRPDLQRPLRCRR